MRLKHEGLKFEHYILGILLAVEMIMSFTFLGYIHKDPISVTTAYIPIIVIACLFGPAESAVAGLFFGLGSMYKASAFYVLSDDKLFSPFQSDFPLGSIMLSVGSRVLFGLLIGLLFQLVKRSRYSRAGKCLCALIAPTLHAMLVYGAMGLFFPEKGVYYGTAFHIKMNDCVIALMCLVAVLVLDAVYHSSYVNYYREAINNTERAQIWSVKTGVAVGFVTVFMICMAAISTIYFSDRTQHMLDVYGVGITNEMSHDILHLQIQFLAAMLALNFILILIILMVYNYMKYREYQSEMDALTEVMGRGIFLNYCVRCQSKVSKRKTGEGKAGWFLFVDVDWFKQINDTLGHVVGDETLRQVAANLKNIFSGYGAVGRVGGDEFAVIIEAEMSREQLEKKLEEFYVDIATILSDQKVSCSIGVYHFEFPEDVQALLAKTDKVLYKAKEHGKACYEIRDDVL